MNLNGSAALEAQINIITGEASLDFAGSNISASGAFGIDTSFFKDAKIGVKYESEMVTGFGTIGAPDISLPMIDISSSSITVGLGESLSVEGSAQVNAVNGLFVGDMSASFDGSDFDAEVSGDFNPPGLQPVQLTLTKQGDQISGSASTAINIPFTKTTNLTVRYENGEFGGRADIELAIPFLESGTGYVEITPQGQVNGGITVNAGDIKLPLVTVNDASISGEIEDGKLSVVGSGSVSGIPCVQSADFELGIDDGNFHGKIGVDVDMPFLKKARGELEMHTDQSISGSVSLMRVRQLPGDGSSAVRSRVASTRTMPTSLTSGMALNCTCWSWYERMSFSQ